LGRKRGCPVMRGQRAENAGDGATNRAGKAGAGNRRGRKGSGIANERDKLASADGSLAAERTGSRPGFSRNAGGCSRVTVGAGRKGGASERLSTGPGCRAGLASLPRFSGLARSGSRGADNPATESFTEGSEENEGRKDSGITCGRSVPFYFLGEVRRIVSARSWIEQRFPRADKLFAGGRR
jgi:hypothetical protein